MKKIEKKYVKREPDVQPGDTVKVHFKIVEGGSERVQIFEGVVISVKGSGLRKNIVVRKMSHGVGVEKIIPVNSPVVKKIDVIDRGNVRRSKLYYMRKKVGKRALDVNREEGFESVFEIDEEELAKMKAKEEAAKKKTNGEEVSEDDSSESNNSQTETPSKQKSSKKSDDDSDDDDSKENETEEKKEKEEKKSDDKVEEEEKEEKKKKESKEEKKEDKKDASKSKESEEEPEEEKKEE